MPTVYPTVLRRRRVRSRRRTLVSIGSTPQCVGMRRSARLVVAQEEFVEVGWPGGQVDGIVVGDEFESRSDVPDDIEGYVVSVDGCHLDAGACAQARRIDRAPEVLFHLARRGRAQSLDGILRDQSPVFDDRDLVRYALHFVEFMGGQEDCATFADSFAQEVPELALHQGVEPGCGLIEDQ